MKSLTRILAFVCTAALAVHPFQVQAAEDGFHLEQDAWAFSNAAPYFNDAYLDNMLPEHYELLCSNLNHVEYRLVEGMTEWDHFRGYCYGMAVTSMLASAGVFVPSEHKEEFGDYAEHITQDLTSVDRLKGNWTKGTPLYEQSLIAYYMMMQNTDAVRQASVNICDWSDQKKVEFLMQHGAKRQPVLLFYNAYNGDQYFGHAVVAYGLEHLYYSLDGIDYDARILIYDPNMKYDPSSHPDMQHRALDMYVNSQTGDWLIRGYELYKGEEWTFDLLGLIDDIAAINDKGLLPGTEYTPPEWTDVMATNTLESAYTVTIPESGEALQEYPWFYDDGDEAVRQNFLHRGDAAAYTLQLEKPQDLHSAVYYQNQMLVGDSAAGTEAAFDPSGIVSVSGDTAGYSLEMVTNEKYPTQWYDIIVSGTAKSASLSMQDSGYLLTADDLHSVRITAKNMNSRLEQSYSTDAGSILFSESSDGVLTAAVDLDGNGTFETMLDEQYLLGDVNDDGCINAKDANEVLIAAARIGTGQASGLNETRQKAADVDHDGRINAEDAAWILRYAAGVGTGTVYGSLDDFINNQDH